MTSSNFTQPIIILYRFRCQDSPDRPPLPVQTQTQTTKSSHLKKISLGLTRIS